MHWKTPALLQKFPYWQTGAEKFRNVVMRKTLELKLLKNRSHACFCSALSTPLHEFLQIVLKLLHSRHHLSPGNNPRAPRFEGRKMNTNPSGICLGSLQIRQAKYSLFRFLQATDFHPTSEKLQNLSCTASLSASSCSISWKITPIRLQVRKWTGQMIILMEMLRK